MAASFSALSANQVCTDVETFLDVLGVADHVHVEHACFVETLDDVFGWYANG